MVAINSSEIARTDTSKKIEFNRRFFLCGVVAAAIGTVLLGNNNPSVGEEVSESDQTGELLQFAIQMKQRDMQLHTEGTKERFIAAAMSGLQGRDSLSDEEIAQAHEYLREIYSRALETYYGFDD